MYHVAPPLKIQGGVVYFNVKPQPKLKLNQVIFGAVTSPNSQWKKWNEAQEKQLVIFATSTPRAFAALSNRTTRTDLADAWK